jgi:hypothetical protein
MKTIYQKLSSLRKEIIAGIKALVLEKGGAYSMVYTKATDNLSFCKATTEEAPEEVKIAVVYVSSEDNVHFMTEDGLEYSTSELFTDDLYDIFDYLENFQR